MVVLARSLREVGVARYKDRDVEFELYPTQVPAQSDLPEWSQQPSRPEEEPDDDEMWASGGAKPPNLLELSKGQFGSGS